MAYRTGECPLQNIVSRIDIPVMHAAALFTYPLALFERELALDAAASAARLAAGEEAANLPNFFAFFAGDVLEDLHEGVEAEVADLAPPQAFHAIEVEVFDSHHVILPKQLSGKFEVPVSTLVGNSAVQLRHAQASLAAVIAALLLARERALTLCHLVQRRLEVLRRVVFFFVRGRKKGFQPEVQPDSITCSWKARLDLVDDGEADPQIAAAVTLDGHSFDLPLNRAREVEAVRLFAHTQPANAGTFWQLPARLGERERLVLAALFEVRTARLGIVKKALVRLIQPLNHVLPGLRVQPIPPAFLSLFELRQMPLELVVTGVLPVDFVEAPSKGHEVVPDVRPKPNLPMQVLIPLRAEQLVLVRLANLHRSGLTFNVLLDNLLAHLTSRAHEVRARPQRRQLKQALVLFAENTAASAFEGVRDLIRSVPGVCLNEEVKMIGLDRQRHDQPLVLGGNFFNDLPQTISDRPLEDPLSSLWTPDEVIPHGVNGVTASLVCLFVDCHTLSTARDAYGSRYFGGFLACEHENHQRRGPRIPALKGEGLQPLRASPVI